MDAPDPNPAGPQEPRGRDGPLQGERITGPDAGGGQLLAGAAVSDPDEARRFIEAQCCSRWPI